MIPAGPPPQAPDQSVPCRTFTASSGSECCPPDLHRKPRIKVFPAGDRSMLGTALPMRCSIYRLVIKYLEILDNTIIFFLLRVLRHAAMLVFSVLLFSIR